jgi:hypothetical protein
MKFQDDVLIYNPVEHKKKINLGSDPLRPMSGETEKSHNNFSKN